MSSTRRRLAGPSPLRRRSPAIHRAAGGSRQIGNTSEFDRCLLTAGTTRSGCFVLLGGAGPVARLRIGQRRGERSGADTAILLKALDKAVLLLQSSARVELIECQVWPGHAPPGELDAALLSAGFTPCVQDVLEYNLRTQESTPPGLPPRYRLAAGLTWTGTQLDAAGYTEYEAFAEYPWQHLELRPWTLAQATALVAETAGRSDFCPDASAAVLHDGLAVAIILVTRPVADQGFVAELAVRRAYQGQGLGIALIHHAHTALSGLGCTLVRLHVPAGFPAGQFYPRLGYQVSGHETTYRWRRGVSASLAAAGPAAGTAAGAASGHRQPD